MHATWTLARAHTHRHISGQRDWRKDFWEEKGFQGMSSQSEQDFFNFKICVSKLEDQTTHKVCTRHLFFIFYTSKFTSIAQTWGPNKSHSLQRTFWLQNSEVFPKFEDQTTHSLHLFFFTSKLQAFPKLEDQTIPPVCTGSFCFKFTSISQTRQLIKIHKHFPNVRTISQDCWLLQNVNSTCVIWWTVTLATCCRWHTDLNQVMKWFQVK